MTNLIATTIEGVNLDQLAKEAAEQKEAIEKLDFLLLSHWKQIVYDFEASIDFMETALKFHCMDTAETIKRDLRKSNPFTWAAYVNDNRSDMSSADGGDR